MNDTKPTPDTDPNGAIGPESETPDQATLHQDSYRRVLLGQVSDPVFPPHPEPPEAPEDELTQQAIQDPDAGTRDASRPAPFVWRVLFLVAVAVAALAIIFLWRR